MKKPSRRLIFLLALGALAVMLALEGITWFFFPAYKLAVQALILLLTAAMYFYAGIKQIRAAQRREAPPLTWWKHSLILMALAFGCLGVMTGTEWLYTASKLFHDGLDTPVGTGMFILFVLFTCGLGIYAISLTIEQMTTSKRPRQEQEERRRSHF